MMGEAAASNASGAARKRNLGERLAEISEGRYWAYLLLAPSLLLVLAVVIYPVVSGIVLSFQQYNLTRAAQGATFVGLQQYIELFEDAEFWVIVRNTFVWVAGGASIQFVVGLITAMALHRKNLKGGPIARMLMLLPWVIPSVVAGHMWALLLDYRLGVINDLLVKIGLLDAYKAWFADPATAMPAVMLVDLWRGFPFFTLLLYAGLQSISEDLYEAAEVDGANATQKFIRITLPMLTPVIVAAVILRVIGLVNSPDLMIVLTDGGPGLATFTLSLYAFRIAYLNFNFGAAAAVSVVMLAILMVFTILYMRFSGVTRNT